MPESVADPAPLVLLLLLFVVVVRKQPPPFSFPEGRKSPLWAFFSRHSLPRSQLPHPPPYLPPGPQPIFPLLPLFFRVLIGWI